MKRSLLLSLSLNALALPIVGWILWQQPQPPAASLAGGQASPAVMKANSQAPAPNASPPFHWSQLESPDYPTFIANLRAIGCPEHTIRLLVDGELRLILAEKIAAQSSPQANVSPPTIDQLETERLTLLDHLLQPADSAPLPSASTSGTASADGAGSTPATAATASAPPALTESIPAAFLVGDAEGGISDGELSTVVTDPRLSPEDADQLNRLRQDFKTSVLPDGQSAASPDSREYFRRWRRAQQESDDRFSSLYGGEALDALHRQRLLQASQSSASSSN